jgi:thiol-disulfide isomerase/thioredoxin
VNGTGAIVLAIALVATAALAWWLRTRNGAIRPAAPETGSEAGAVVRSPLNPVFERLGVRPDAADLTVVQFSTAFCAPCRTTRARLQQLQATRPGLGYVHVDAESHLDEVRELDVRRTPTLFYLRRDGSVLARSSGAPQPEELTALVDAHVPGDQQ